MSSGFQAALKACGDDDRACRTVLARHRKVLVDVRAFMVAFYYCGPCVVGMTPAGRAPEDHGRLWSEEGSRQRLLLGMHRRHQLVATSHVWLRVRWLSGLEIAIFEADELNLGWTFRMLSWLTGLPKYTLALFIGHCVLEADGSASARGVLGDSPPFESLDLGTVVEATLVVRRRREDTHNELSVG